MPSPALLDSLPSDRFVDRHMQTMVLHSLQEKHRDLFPTLQNHFYDHEVGVETDHITELIKTVASFYIRMRLLKAGKLFHQRKILLGQTSQRIKLNKIVLFSGQ
ncbi:hypothetical protein ElyMa_003476500 [Elysia marginata]|uniref:Uncharacterized protein n=1 Tax=Elysia marginata TaxID=1093978 RepID=A0AAV4ECC9_9GAST|nr:hypothetical protein ElyMa_003476500 [Elysia marginata]